MIYKFSANEVSVSTANTVWGGPLIRVVNPTTAVINVTVSNATVNIASFSVRGNSEIIVVKANTDLIQGTGAVASPVAYRS